ncbi:hypothetical protein [Streptomyces sp. NPDC050485]|uniref:hypothetical protein n=1 Tax=Streptomyces sp. NPDC050485 TaxID=3365617 RepID=UPI00379E3E37
MLKFLADPVAYGLEPDLSDLTVVHAVTGEEWPASLSYVDRLVLPLLATRKVRTVQIARGGRRDADGVLILGDTRRPLRIWAAGPWRLSDELRAAGTVPQMASGRRTSIRFKGWALDAWAAFEFGTAPFRRVIGYNGGERDRAEKDSTIQARLNAEAGRVVCEPYYPLIETDSMDRAAAVEAYVHARLGEPIRKSACSFCPFSGVCASRGQHEEWLRESPELASAALMMEYTSQALNEKVALYGERSLYQRLAEDERNGEVLTRFEQALDQAPFALYEVRRLYLPGRTKDCRTWHGKRCTEPRWWCRTKRSASCRRKHRAGLDLTSGWLETAPWCEGYGEECRGDQAKGQAWRSVRTVWEGSRREADLTLMRWGREAEARLRSGPNSMIKRAHYVDAGDGYPSASAYLVAGPAGVEDKQRTAKKPDAGFEAKWTGITGLAGTRWEPLRPLISPIRRTAPVVPVRHILSGSKGQPASGMGLIA